MNTQMTGRVLKATYDKIKGHSTQAKDIVKNVEELRQKLVHSSSTRISEHDEEISTLTKSLHQYVADLSGQTYTPSHTSPADRLASICSHLPPDELEGKARKQGWIAFLCHAEILYMEIMIHLEQSQAAVEQAIDQQNRTIEAVAKRTMQEKILPTIETVLKQAKPKKKVTFKLDEMATTVEKHKKLDRPVNAHKLAQFNDTVSKLYNQFKGKKWIFRSEFEDDSDDDDGDEDEEMINDDTIRVKDECETTDIEDEDGNES